MSQFCTLGLVFMLPPILRITISIFWALLQFLMQAIWYSAVTPTLPPSRSLFILKKCLTSDKLDAKFVAHYQTYPQLVVILKKNYIIFNMLPPEHPQLALTSSGHFPVASQILHMDLHVSIGFLVKSIIFVSFLLKWPAMTT